MTCLFFDQVNNYSNFRCLNQATRLPSTDLSTVIVDKCPKPCQTKAYTLHLVVIERGGYHERLTFAAWRCAPKAGARRFCCLSYRGSHESRHPSRIQTHLGHLHLRQQVR